MSDDDSSIDMAAAPDVDVVAIVVVYINRVSVTLKLVLFLLIEKDIELVNDLLAIIFMYMLSIISLVIILLIVWKFDSSVEGHCND